MTWLPLSAAARMQVVMELLAPPIYDEDGRIVGHSAPLITLTAEEIVAILEAP